jgi:signal transduction histidine kinase
MSSLSDILQKLASGQIPADVPADCECSDQLRELTGYLDDLRRFVGALTNGDLNASIRCPGPLAGSLKGLHANLRHLTWQTQQIAAGDFSQHVDFMGEFSDAFNSMVAALAQARTDLTERNQQLADTCEQLKSLNETLEDRISEEVGNNRKKDAILLQQDKLASLGQLAAGVAHEINNPIGFISSNLSTLDKYLTRLTMFIGLHTEKLIQFAPSELSAEIETNRKSLKLDRIMKDAGTLIQESLDGVDRVRKIVQNLKTFSRMDESKKTFSDINEVLEGTINIAWNELKYKATLKKELGNLPPIICNPQQLGQVFMNLLVNASHAIENQGEVALTTWSDNEFIYVSVADTGCGIPKEIQSKIFEPFFTTKEVGKGTGLGLSISYDIIKKHGGDIHVSSEENKGTTFTIRLPFVAGSE